MMGNRGDTQEATVRRSRPFLTILEADTAGRKVKKPLGRRFRSPGGTRAVHPISFPGTDPEQLPEHPGRPLPSIGKALIQFSRIRMGLAGQVARFELPRIGIPGLLERLGQVKIAPRRAIIAATLAFAGLLTISAGATALIAARKFPVGISGFLLPDEDSAQASLLSYLAPDDADAEDAPSGSLPPIPVSVKISSYTVKSGDSLDTIARRFGLRQDTIISANNLQKASSVHSGLTLRIPNMNGVSYSVRKGESLQSVAKAFGVEVTGIVDANDLASGSLSSGQNLFIPNAKLSSASLKDFYGERFMWPARGGISSPFGYRSNPFTGLKTFHSAIDIAVNSGTRVKAAGDGTVADTGYNSVFGNYIILKHSSGYQSLYGHLSSILVHEGAKVTQGGVIALSGNTGQSTGPHLHFSIFKNGQALDPRKFVK